MTEGCQGNRPIKIKEKRNIEFILDAPYVSSPNLITVKDLKLLKPGIKIRVADDVFTRLQYISGISRLFPGKEYIIKEVKVNEGDTVNLDISSIDDDGDTTKLTFSGWMTSSTKKTSFDDAGTYNVTVIYQQTQNYTYKNITYYVNVSDITSPNITLFGPQNNSVTNNVNVVFTYNVSDFSRVENCTLYIGIDVSQNNQSYVSQTITNNFTLELWE